MHIGQVPRGLGVATIIVATAAANPPPGAPCVIDGSSPGNCQLPNQSGNGAGGTTAATSDDAVGFRVSDNLAIAGGGTITSVCWWGSYTDFTVPCAGPDSAVAFTITFYNSWPSCPAGVPGTIKAGPFAVLPAAAPTGAVIPSGLGALIEWGFSAGIPPVAVADGECLWMEIKNDAGAGTCLWLWSTAPPGDGLSYQAGAGRTNDFDLAWCIDAGALALADCALEPIAPCVGASGDCGLEHATPGCVDDCCCTLVCQQDSSCCDVAWDQLCAVRAANLGCATLPWCDSCVPGGQTPSTENAFNSTRNSAGADLFVAADDFTADADGSITSPCWWGAYLPLNVVDSFRIRYLQDTDGDHVPDAVIAAFDQADGTLVLTAKESTPQVVAGILVLMYHYAASHAALPVTAGECLWIEISNDVGAGGTDWYWEMTERGPVPGIPGFPPRQGNGLFLIDGSGGGVPPDGYTAADERADIDLAFCLGLALREPACEFATVFDTGVHEHVLFNGASTPLGWSSGNLDDAGLAQRRTAQPFSLPAGDWELRQILLEGFEVAGAVNEFINFEIFTRTGLDVPPTPADSVTQILDVPFDGGIDPLSTRFGLTHAGAALSGGDYWLAFWPSNDRVPFIPSNMAWFTNAPDGINAFCTERSPPPTCPGALGCLPSDPDGAPPGSPKMLRACTYPVPGFGSSALGPGVLEVDPIHDPTPDPADLYNAAFLIRAFPAAPASCPWDCQASPDSVVGVTDLLAMLAQWGAAGGTCDFDGGGVGISDLLKLLANWAPCP